MAKNYEQLASEILSAAGGEGNIAVVSHCYTRLRLTVNDASKVEGDRLKKIKGVMGVVERGNDFQVVIGTDVSALYPVFLKQGTFKDGGNVEPRKDDEGGDKKKVNPAFYVLDFISGTFSPCIPVLIAGGLAGAVLTILTNFFGVASTSGTYAVFSLIQQSAFFFLPVYVGFAAAKKLNINAFLGAFLGAILLYFNLYELITSRFAEGGAGLDFIGIPIQNISYGTTVFPILLGVCFMALVYNLFMKILPKEIRVVFLPVLTMIITVPVTLIVLGPVGNTVGNWLAAGLSWLYTNAAPVAVMVIGAATPFLVFFGMNNALYPLIFALFADIGCDPLVCAGMLAANIAVGAACLAVGFKSKNSDTKSVAISAGVTGCLGITEPGVYGVLFPMRRPLIAAVIGGAAGGLVTGIFRVAAYAIASPSFASLPIFIPAEGTGGSITNFYFAIGIAIFSFIVSFVAAWILGVREEAVEEISNNV